MPWLVWKESVAFSLNTASDGDTTTSAGSWFHSLDVLGKKWEFKGILRAKGRLEFIRMTVPCSCFRGELQIIIYIQINKSGNKFVHHT